MFAWQFQIYMVNLNDYKPKPGVFWEPVSPLTVQQPRSSGEMIYEHKK